MCVVIWSLAYLVTGSDIFRVQHFQNDCSWPVGMVLNLNQGQTSSNMCLPSGELLFEMLDGSRKYEHFCASSMQDLLIVL